MTSFRIPLLCEKSRETGKQSQESKISADVKRFTQNLDVTIPYMMSTVKIVSLGDH